MRYESRPSRVEAIRWEWEDLDPQDGKMPLAKHNFEEVDEFCSRDGVHRVQLSNDGAGPMFLLAGQDGAQEWVPVPPGHWIVRRENDLTDHWPVDHNHFSDKYYPLGDESDDQDVARDRGVGPVSDVGEGR